MIRGSCLCGDIAWEFEGTAQFMGACHCSMCRKAHGSACSTVVAIPSDGFHLVRGKDRIAGYASSPGSVRSFCSRCGSPSPAAPDEPRQLMLPAGCIDDGDPGVRLAAHIFVASKAPWHEIEDDAARFEAYPPGLDAPVIERARGSQARAGAVRGSCLCGGVTYELQGEHETILNCHCSRCRKSHGALYASLILCHPEQLRWLSGENLVERFKVPDAARFTHCFCRTCGSSLPQDHAQYPVVVPAGSLDDDPGARARCHIFTGSKLAFFDIPGDLPQFEAYPTRPV